MRHSYLRSSSRRYEHPIWRGNPCQGRHPRPTRRHPGLARPGELADHGAAARGASVCRMRRGAGRAHSPTSHRALADSGFAAPGQIDGVRARHHRSAGASSGSGSCLRRRSSASRSSRPVQGGRVTLASDAEPRGVRRGRATSRGTEAPPPYLCGGLASSARSGVVGVEPRWGGGAWARLGVGVVRAGAQPYFGPRPSGWLRGRRHDV